jgi:hypothetical protein
MEREPAAKSGLTQYQGLCETGRPLSLARDHVPVVIEF